MDPFDRLLYAYRRGLLVPFTGGGLSAGDNGCPLWARFVANMERQAGTDRELADRRGDLAQRAAHAVRRLRYRQSPDALARAVRRALKPPQGEPPPQSRALAKVQWPLVVTTNYDDLYLAAVEHERRKRLPIQRLLDKEIAAAPLVLLGRSRLDCQRVLASLRQVDEPILWALQGFVGGQDAELAISDKWYTAKVKELEEELVVGHAEYRRVAFRAEHFRRAIAEVFRSCSFLFLGSSLGEPYFLNLFDEIIELYGQSPMEHFAVMARDSCDTHFLSTNLGIAVHEIADHEALPAWLEKLSTHLTGKPTATTTWTHRTALPYSSELRIVQGPLPKRPARGESIAFSAGGHKATPTVGKSAAAFLKREYGLRNEDQEQALLEGRPTMVYRFPGSDLYTVNARLHPFQPEGALRCPSNVHDWPVDPSGRRRNVGGRRRRDLRLLGPAVRDLMAVVHNDGVKRVRVMLLAAGKLRAFGRSYAFNEMVRGYVGWLRSLPLGTVAAGLVIHVTAPEVIVDLTSRRIDLEERFVLDGLGVWIEILTRRGETNRLPRRLSPQALIRDVLLELDITDSAWEIDLTPRPSLSWQPWRLPDIETWEAWARQQVGGDVAPDGGLTVERLGVVSGSTIRLRQLERC